MTRDDGPFNNTKRPYGPVDQVHRLFVLLQPICCIYDLSMSITVTGATSCGREPRLSCILQGAFRDLI